MKKTEYTFIETDESIQKELTNLGNVCNTKLGVELLVARYKLHSPQPEKYLARS
jgi:hypothetical protein